MGRRPSASNFGLRHIGTNSFGWDQHGTKTPNFMAVFSLSSGVRTIESSLIYGAGDGNRTHVPSLGSLQFKLNKRWIGVILIDLKVSQMENNGKRKMFRFDFLTCVT
jgi:hypothetical protein